MLQEVLLLSISLWYAYSLMLVCCNEKFIVKMLIEQPKDDPNCLKIVLLTQLERQHRVPKFCDALAQQPLVQLPSNLV